MLSLFLTRAIYRKNYALAFLSNVGDAFGNPICNGTTLTGIYAGYPVTGAANPTIVLDAFPSFLTFLNPRTGSPPDEIFAETYAFISGFGDNLNASPGSDNIYFVGGVESTGGWACVRASVLNLTVYGITTYNQEQYSYGVPDGPITSGPNAGYYGPGLTSYRCDQTTTHFNFSFGT